VDLIAWDRTIQAPHPFWNRTEFSNMSYFLSGYFYVVMVPFILVVLPASLIYYIRFLSKKNDRLVDIQESLVIWLCTALTTFIFIETKPAIRIFPTSSVPYILLAIIQVLLFTLLPVLPYLLHRIIYKKSSKKSLERIATSYAPFCLIALLLFVHLIVTTPALPAILAKDPLVAVKILNITEIYIIFQSSLF
jgi:hypothetical protein